MINLCAHDLSAFLFLRDLSDRLDVSSCPFVALLFALSIEESWWDGTKYLVLQF